MIARREDTGKKLSRIEKTEIKDVLKEYQEYPEQLALKIKELEAKHPLKTALLWDNLFTSIDKLYIDNLAKALVINGMSFQSEKTHSWALRFSVACNPTYVDVLAKTFLEGGMSFADGKNGDVREVLETKAEKDEECEANLKSIFRRGGLKPAPSLVAVQSSHMSQHMLG